MAASSSSGRKPIRQLIRELNERFEQINKFNDTLVRLGAGFEAVDQKVTALEREMGQVEECLVRLVTDHNQLVKLLQPPELQRYPADLMPREVRTDEEGKVVESKLVTSFQDGGVLAGGGPDNGAGGGDAPSLLGTIHEEREAQEAAVHTLTRDVPTPRPTSPVTVEEPSATQGLVFEDTPGDYHDINNLKSD